VAKLSRRLPEFLLIVTIIAFVVIMLILENSQYSYSRYVNNLTYDKIKDLITLIVSTNGFMIAFTGIIASTLLRYILEKEEKLLPLYSGMVGDKAVNVYKEKRSQVIKFVFFILITLIFSIAFSLGVILTQNFFYLIISIIFFFIGLIEIIGMITYSLLD
jgi:hypothetical protein